MIDTKSQSPSDEIDVLALVRALWRGKYAIVLITALFGAAAVYVALTATPIFSAQAAVTPVRDSNLGGGSSLAGQFGGLASIAGVNLRRGGAGSEYHAVLRSRLLVEEFIKRNELLDVLSPPDGEPLSLWYGVKQFREKVLSIVEDDKTGITRLVVSWTDPQVAAQWANGLVALANELIRQRALADAQRNIEYLNQQIEDTSVVGLERVMYNLIESETKTLMLANAREDYAFAVVDPAVAPEARSKPKRKLIVISGAGLGVLFSVFAVLAFYFIRRVVAEGAHTEDRASAA